MKNDLILRRKIKLESWIVSGRIQRAEKRPEYNMVLKCVRDGCDTAKSIAQHLLFEDRSRLGIAENLLRQAQELGLIQKGGRGEKRHQCSLSEAGEKALEEGRIYVPEEGVWEVTFSDDPMIPFPIVELKQFKEPSAREEVLYRNKDKTEKRLDNLCNISPWIKQKVKNLDGQPCVGGAPLFIEFLKSKGERLNNEQLMFVEWNVTKKTYTLSKEDEIINHFSSPRMGFEKVWIKLLEHNRFIDKWNKEKRALEVRFNRLNENCRKTMTVDIRFDSPEVGASEPFDNFTAQGVKLRPVNLECAQEWSVWLLNSMVDNYASKVNYEKWSELVRQSFEDFTVVLPKMADLAKTVHLGEKARTKRDWHLVAALDWEL